MATTRNKPSQQSKSMLSRFLPGFIIQIITQLVSFLNYNMNLAIPFLGIKKHHFGSFLLTNVTHFPGFHEVSSVEARHTDLSPISQDH